MAGEDENRTNNTSVPVVATYVRGFYVASGSQLTIEKWNGEGDFEKWQQMMKEVLRRNRVHRVVFDIETLPADISSVELEEMEEWAFTTLQLAMGKIVISEISQETTTRGI